MTFNLVEVIFEERKVFKDNEGYYAIIYKLQDAKEIYKVKIGKTGEPCHKYGQDRYFNQFIGVLEYIDYIMPIIKKGGIDNESNRLLVPGQKVIITQDPSTITITCKTDGSITKDENKE